MLNDKINEIIYNKAGAYKQKTLEALLKSSDQISPRGRRERAAAFGIYDESDARLRHVIESEKYTTEKAIHAF